MIRFYFHPTPNPLKVALFICETGLPYELFPVDTRKGEQHAEAFRKINPNGKLPAIVDTEGPGGKEARVFDSSTNSAVLAERRAASSDSLPTGVSFCHDFLPRNRPRALLGTGRAFQDRSAKGAGIRA